MTAVRLALLLFPTLLAAVPPAAKNPGYIYSRAGNPADAAPHPSPGYFLAGGGADLDEGFRFLCAKANGGDLLVLRATGDAAYNPYIRGLCPGLNSVATLIVTSREGARTAFVVQAIHQAEAVFIAGGDQANYINLWQGSPLQDELNGAIARGVPVGGTSAGLDVLSEFIFTALNDTVTSAQALADPFDERVTLDRHFLKIPLLAATVADAHVMARDRMGRDVVFLARIVGQNWARTASGVFLDEKTALLVEPSGKATVAGNGSAWFLRTPGKPENCAPGEPLTFHNVSVYRVAAGGAFDLLEWSGTSGVAYQLNADNGVLKSTQPGGSIY